jgi:hypothetical protein
MAFIETNTITIQDLIAHLEQFPKDAIICTHNSHAWNSNRVKAINKSDLDYFITKVDNPEDCFGDPMPKDCVSIFDLRRVDY